MRPIGLILLVFFAFSGLLRAEPEDGGVMTHGELARKLCFISGLAETLRPPITASKAIDAVSQQGWAPIQGWRLDAYATREDFYVVMAKYLGLRPEGPADQPASYLKALLSEGYSVDAGPQLSASLDPAPPRLQGGVPMPVLYKTVLEVKGQAECRSGAEEDWKKLNAYDRITQGMEIRTSGGAEVVLWYAPGCTQQILGESLVRFEKISVPETPGAPVQLRIELENGRMLTFVQPLPAGSRVEVRNPLGAVDVDVVEGCEFQSEAVNAAPVPVDTAFREELGFSELAQIQQASFRHTSFRGKALGIHINGGRQFVRQGESLMFLLNGLRLGSADRFDYGAIVKRFFGQLQRSQFALLTESEIRSFLSSLGYGGACEVPVTPIGR